MTTKDTIRWRVTATPKDIAEYAELLELQENEAMIHEGLDGITVPKDRWYAAKDLICDLRDQRADEVPKLFAVMREHLDMASRHSDDHRAIAPESINNLGDLIALGTATPYQAEIIGRAFGASHVLTALDAAICMGGSPDAQIERARSAIAAVRKDVKAHWIAREMAIKRDAGHADAGSWITELTHNKDLNLAWWAGQSTYA